VKRYTVGEVARELGIARQSIYNWIYSGRIQARRYWTAEDIEQVRRARKSFVSRRGRPRKIVDAGTVACFRAEGLSWRTIGLQLGCSVPVARRAL
jgi:IS30 family transposase